jgi:spermidine synthase
MVFVSGLAGLTWELLWQLRADLALGVSALGAAITLACTMGGMALGSWALGRALRRFAVARPLRAFAALEVVVGLAGQALGPAFDALERVDSAVYARSPSLAPMLHALGVALVLGPPTVAMGATLPVFRLVGERHGASVARLYGINTAGASLGVLLAAFVVLPKLGLSLTASLASVLNLSVAAAAWLLAAAPEGPGSPLAEPSRPGRPEPTGPVAPASARALAFGTGLATFVLQVAWFRSLRAAFQSSTDSFALVLASMLVPLALGAHLAVALRRRRPVAAALVSAGVLALVVTPAIERFDLISLQVAGYWHAVALRFAVSLTVLGAAVLPLGVVLPLLLDQSADASESGALYSSNTVGGVFGALLAGWVLLPTLGSVRAAWLAGVVLVAAGLAVSRGRQRLQAGTLGALALAFAVAAQSGVGRTRVQKAPGLRVVRAEEGPDASVAVVQGPTGARSLFIDGFDTTWPGWGASQCSCTRRRGGRW